MKTDLNRIILSVARSSTAIVLMHIAWQCTHAGTHCAPHPPRRCSWRVLCRVLASTQLALSTAPNPGQPQAVTPCTHPCTQPMAYNLPRRRLGCAAQWLVETFARAFTLLPARKCCSRHTSRLTSVAVAALRCRSARMSILSRTPRRCV